MLPQRLLERIKKYHTVFQVVLPDHEFIYNNKSIDGTAKANVKSNDGKVVHGVCFEIDEDDFAVLKKYEGGYDQRNIVVTTKNGNKTKAVTYISASIDASLVASAEYKSMVVNGAKHWGLSESYISEYLS